MRLSTTFCNFLQRSMVFCNFLQLPMTFYNISSSLGNNLFKIVDSNNNSNTIILPDSQYNPVSLASAINDQLTLLGIDLTFDLSNNEHVCNIKNHSLTATYTVQFAISSNGSCIGVNADFDKNLLKSKLGWSLGFRNVEHSISPSGSQTSESVYFFNQKDVFLIVEEFSKGNQNTFISPLQDSLLNKNILAKISLDYESFPFGSILNANNGGGNLISDCRSYSGKVNLQRLKLQLVTIHGLPINMNGVDFSFTLEITYE